MFNIEKDLLVEVLNYLAKRPFFEVSKLIAKLQQASNSKENVNNDEEIQTE